MKKNVILTMSLLLVSMSTNASVSDYKCYVELQDKAFQIAFVDAKQAKTSIQAGRILLNQGVYAPDGKQIMKVKKVIECQRMEMPFIDAKANQADKRTPR